jgi:hypothetical protein
LSFFCFFTFILSFELQCPPIFPHIFLIIPLFLSYFFSQNDMADIPSFPGGGGGVGFFK